MRLASFTSVKELRMKETKKQPLYAVIHGSYSACMIGIYKGQECLAQEGATRTRASAHLLPFFEQALTKAGCSLSQLTALGVDVGPGAFTSLRVVVSTANGLSYGSHIPLIPLDGLSLFTHFVLATYRTRAAVVLTLFNAFNQEAYYQLWIKSEGEKESRTTTAYASIDTIIAMLKPYDPEKIVVAGAGSAVFYDVLRKALPGAQFAYPEHTHAPLSYYADAVLTALSQNHSLSSFLQPSYLKSHSFKKLWE